MPPLLSLSSSCFTDQHPVTHRPANVINLFTSNAALLERFCSLLRLLHLSSLAGMVEAWAAGIRAGVLFFSIPPDADDTGCTQVSD
jgi:hypothetical protein